MGKNIRISRQEDKWHIYGNVHHVTNIYECRRLTPLQVASPSFLLYSQQARGPEAKDPIYSLGKSLYLKDTDCVAIKAGRLSSSTDKIPQWRQTRRKRRTSNAQIDSPQRAACCARYSDIVICCDAQRNVA